MMAELKNKLVSLDSLKTFHDYNDDTYAKITYVDDQISSIASTGIPKLVVYPLSQEATVDGQTEFEIDLDNFDIDTDTVLVQSGRTMLFPDVDFTVSSNKVTLNEGVPSGRTIGIYVFKNVPIGNDGSISGVVLKTGSLPLDRLAEDTIPVVNANSNAYDLDAILKSGVHCRMYRTNSVTLGTPYKYGVSAASQALVLSYASSNTHGHQMAFMSGGLSYVRTYANGVIGNWNTGFLPLTGGILNGNVNVKKSSNWGQFLATSASGYYRAFESDDSRIRLDVRDVDQSSDRRFLDFYSKTGMSDLAKALQLANVVSGTTTSYKIYGEHNVTKSTTDLAAGTSSLATGCIHLVYE